MYLGGNGFYATTSYDPENRHVVEVRRADGGTRPHQSPFAEQAPTTSGESAGLWRNKGKAPERLVGVGMSAQGFDRCTYYERLEDSFDARAAFIFEGVGADELLGRLRHHRRRRRGLGDRLLQPGPRDATGHAGAGHVRDRFRTRTCWLPRSCTSSSPALEARNSRRCDPTWSTARCRRGRWLLLGRVNRVDRIPVARRVQQQHRPDHHERAATVS